MIIGILKEPEFENRVAMLPESVETAIKMKAKVIVETQAGTRAFASDADYTKAGAQILSQSEVIKQADVIIKIQTITQEEIAQMRENQILINVINPYFNLQIVKALEQKNISSFSLDLVPRTTRAQAMDILSSMATIAGYKAVLTAAGNLPNFFPMFMTAAGTIKPAKVLILGAGVAGLQAIATARKLGAQVEVFDVRSAVKEEVMSLGGKFIEVEGAKEDKTSGGYAVEQSEEFKQKQAQLIHNHAIKANVVICTAQIPGRKAPILLKLSTVEAMMPGSVIIDLAASTGGNCEGSKNAETNIINGVKIIGNSNFPSEMPSDASRMFGKNLTNFLNLIINKEGNLHLNFADDIVQGSCLTHNKQIVNEKVKNATNNA